jgi:hypothetical protein
VQKGIITSSLHSFYTQDGRKTGEGRHIRHPNAHGKRVSGVSGQSRKVVVHFDFRVGRYTIEGEGPLSLRHKGTKVLGEARAGLGSSVTYAHVPPELHHIE